MNGDVESGYRNIGYSRDGDEIYEQIKGWKNLHVQERKKLRIQKNETGRDGNRNMQCLKKGGLFHGGCSSRLMKNKERDGWRQVSQPRQERMPIL